MVTLHDAVILTDLLKDLRPQAHVAYGAEAVTRGAAEGNPLPHLGHLLEQGEETGFHLRQQ